MELCCHQINLNPSAINRKHTRLEFGLDLENIFDEVLMLPLHRYSIQEKENSASVTGRLIMTNSKVADNAHKGALNASLFTSVLIWIPETEDNKKVKTKKQK